MWITNNQSTLPLWSTVSVWYIYEFDLKINNQNWFDFIHNSNDIFSLTVCEPDLKIREFQLISWEFDISRHQYVARKIPDTKLLWWILTEGFLRTKQYQAMFFLNMINFELTILQFALTLSATQKHARVSHLYIPNLWLHVAWCLLNCMQSIASGWMTMFIRTYMTY